MTGRDTAEILQAAEHGLGAPAIFVAQLVVADRALAGACAGGYRHDAGRAQMSPKPIGVVALIGQKAPDAARSGSQHGGRRPHIAGIAWGEMDDGGAAEDVGQDMDLGGRPAARWTDSLIFRPLCRRGRSDAP